MTREKYQRTLVDLDAQVAEMAALARSMLHDGLTAFETLDHGLATVVRGREGALAQLDEDIETEAFQIISLQGPVASDLRRIGAALKLITYLNRVGRYGFDIASIAESWPKGREHVARLVGLREMAAKVAQMLDLVLEAFHGHKAPEMAMLQALEDDVDAMRYTIFREALTYMAQDSQNIEPCSHYMMAARYLERCGDNVCKMAEKLYYAATGKRGNIK